VSEAAYIREGDPVLVLYARNTPQRSVALLEREARAVIEAGRARS
jgi:hypothetical protein